MPSFVPARLVRSFAARVPLALLRSPLARILHLRAQLIVLTVTGRKTGRPFSLVVQYAEHAGSLLVLAGHAERKRWWRNLVEPAHVTLEVGGLRRGGTAHVINTPDEWTVWAVAAYLRRYPASAQGRGFAPDVAVDVALVPRLTEGAVLIRIDPDPAEAGR